MGKPVHRGVWFLCLLLVPLACAGEDPGRLLVRLPLAGSPADVPLPVYAHLQDAAGGEYVLVQGDRGGAEVGRPAV